MLFILMSFNKPGHYKMVTISMSGLDCVPTEPEYCNARTRKIEIQNLPIDLLSCIPWMNVKDMHVVDQRMLP